MVFGDPQELTRTEERRFPKELGHPPGSGLGAQARGQGPSRESARPGAAAPQGKVQPGQWMLRVLPSSWKTAQAPRDQCWGAQSVRYEGAPNDEDKGNNTLENVEEKEISFR